jgi:hypothetical protein
MTGKLKLTTAAIASLSLLVTTPLHAAPDDPFLRHDTAAGQPQVGAVVAYSVSRGPGDDSHCGSA